MEKSQRLSQSWSESKSRDLEFCSFIDGVWKTNEAGTEGSRGLESIVCVCRYSHKEMILWLQRRNNTNYNSDYTLLLWQALFCSLSQLILPNYNGWGTRCHQIIANLIKVAEYYKHQPQMNIDAQMHIYSQRQLWTLAELLNLPRLELMS